MVLAAFAYGLIGSGGATYSFLTAGIGLAVGFTMQFVGRGLAPRFSVLAAVYALVGCLLGNLFAVVIYIARASVVSPFKVLLDSTPGELAGWMVSGLQFTSLLFWILAIGTASYFVKRRLSREERVAVRIYEIGH